TAAASVVIEVEPVRPVLAHDAGGLVGGNAPVVRAVGEAHDVGGEPVAADVRRLPHVGDVRRGERPRHRAAEVGTARVVAPVGADEVQARGSGGAGTGRVRE